MLSRRYSRSSDELARAEVECEDCGGSWQDAWALVDITDAKDKEGRQIRG